MCERRNRIERRRCCRFHRFLQHLRQSVSQKPSCRAGRRTLAECYTFFRFGAGFDDRRVVVWNPTPWRVICCAVRKCGRRSVVARAEVRAKLWGTREAGIRTGRPTGDNLSRTARRSVSAAKDRQTSSCCGCVSERLSRRRKACPAQIRRMQPAPCVCGFIQSRMAAASSVCFAAEKSLPRQAAARGKDAARFLPAVLHRSARRPSRKQGSDGSGVSAAACSMRLMEAGGLILRAAASDAFDVPPHFQSGIMSGRACPALGFAVRRPMFRSKAAVHRASSMRIRKPANALAGKRPKHRCAKPRRRGPRPARDGRRG